VGGLKPGDGVAVIAATNRAEDVDVALLRRFHARVAVPPPAAAELKRMCWAFLEGVEHCIADADLQALSRRLEGN
jgi:SpoVK/Ycf46/Vps4 family AAA+-type ATPase